MKRFVAVFSVAVCAVLLTSCRTTSSGIVVESYPRTKVTINSKMVGSRLQVVQYVGAERNGMYNAQVTVQNTTQKDVPFEYMYRWLNSDGMQVDSGLSTWIGVSVGAKQTAMLNAISPNKEVKDFVLDIRFSSPSTRW